MDQKYRDWKEWLETIRKEVMDLVHSKYIFWKLGDIVKSNPKIQKPNSFYEFAGKTYFAYALMGIRRQIKPHRDSISFAGLLQEIIEMPCVLSRERFVALYETSARFEADHDFAQYSRKNAEHIDPNLVQRDWKKLKKLGREVEVFTDKQIAHCDKRLEKKHRKFEDDASDNKQPPINVPSFGELDDCIDFLAELTEKYWLLFTAETIDLLVMPIVDHWDEIFRQPWIPSDAPNKPIDSDPLEMY